MSIVLIVCIVVVLLCAAVVFLYFQRQSFREKADLRRAFDRDREELRRASEEEKERLRAALTQEKEDLRRTSDRDREELRRTSEEEKERLRAALTQEKEDLRRTMTEQAEARRREYEAGEEGYHRKIGTLGEENASLRAQLESLKEGILTREEYESRFEKRQQEYMDRLKDSFKALSAENSDVFKERSAAAISEILKPVQERFQEFSEAVATSRKDSIERHSRLEQKIEDLDKSSRRVGEDARSLAEAITGHAKFQGNFGEMLLVDILKSAGLQEGVHFSTQCVMVDENGHEIKSEGGRTMIPDVLVHYPDDTTVVVDSKVSLTAYARYAVAETAEEKARYAKAHVESIEKHVNELKSKDYASYLPEGRRKVEYNIMFIPVEDAFRLMLDSAPLLWQQAKDANVLIVSQMTLIIVLNMISMSWKQYEQERNIAEVYKVAEELMTQIKGWLEEYERLGSCIRRTSEVYGNCTNRLSASNRSVLRKIEKLEKLGLAPRKSSAKIRAGARMPEAAGVIPPQLRKAAGGEEDTEEEEVPGEALSGATTDGLRQAAGGGEVPGGALSGATTDGLRQAAGGGEVPGPEEGKPEGTA